VHSKRAFFSGFLVCRLGIGDATVIRTNAVGGVQPQIPSGRATHVIHPHLSFERDGSRLGCGMFLMIALILVLAWIGGFVVFHTAGFLIHLLLIFAVISIIFHFLRGRSSTA
jgi:Family of unknown function (DUF5670)